MSAAESLMDTAFAAVPPPPVRGASPADINEAGDWLIPRMCENWGTSAHLARAYLMGTLASNEQRLMVCGDAMGMAHVEPGRMGHPCRVIVDFVLSRRLTEGVEECCEIYAWMANWARGLQASGLFRVDDFSDADRSYIRGRIGKLTKRESFNCIFVPPEM
jgi:hypothetical protein